MDLPRVVILGAGPTGLSAAAQLARLNRATVTVLEARDTVGGNAGSFEVAGLNVDYGSHRLHPACAPYIMRDLTSMLGSDLQDRPRHGRIRLRGRWIHFPLRPLDIFLRMHPGFTTGVAGDLIHRRLSKNGNHGDGDTFASVLQAGLGRTICRDFYFPYARKLWGISPEDLAATQARRRVSAGSLGKLIRKVLSATPVFKSKGSGRFFYPARGFSRISEAYFREAQAHGVDVKLQSPIREVETDGAAVRAVHFDSPCGPASLEADLVWSTVPITMLVDHLTPSPPDPVRFAASNIGFRGMILVYLVLPVERFSEYDAHYFPEEEIAISRLSEPKNYRSGDGPGDVTVLCAELPCAPDGAEWLMSDAELGDLVLDSLKCAGIPASVQPLEVVTRRLRQAYPIYTRGYDAALGEIDAYVSSIKGLLSFGRQGLFAHDNTHHALQMGYAAASCLRSDGAFDIERWWSFRREFDTHIVED